MSVLLQARDTQNESVLILTMNRPEAMNSFNVEICMAMIDAIKVADADPNVRVIVVTGAGRAFCADSLRRSRELVFAASRWLCPRAGMAADSAHYHG